MSASRMPIQPFSERVDVFGLVRGHAAAHYVSPVIIRYTR